jgi:transcription antitermination factor NusG
MFQYLFGGSYPSGNGEAMLSTLANDGRLLSQPAIPAGVADMQHITQKWFAVYTAPCHEKRVAQQLSLREIDYFLPLYHVRRQWKDGSKVNLALPLFPGYIFVRIKRKERVRVLEVPKVVSIVQGLNREPAPLPDSDIEVLRAGLQAVPAEPHPFLTVGQRARVRSGPLAGREGVLVRKKNSARLVITLDLIMQSIALEIDGDNLEPLEIDPRSCK